MEGFRRLLADCRNDWDVAVDESSDWPNNIISRHAVWDRGVLYHSREPARTPVSDAEVDLCQRLAIEAAGVRGDEQIGMGSEGSEPMSPFYLVATENEPVAGQIDEALIRSRFGGTIFPPATIDVEAVEESGQFWGDISKWVSDESEAYREEYFQAWRKLMKWMKNQPEFKETAFVYMGEYRALSRIPEAEYPSGTQVTGSCLPRLVLGLTERGSLCGVFGYVVQT